MTSQRTRKLSWGEVFDEIGTAGGQISPGVLESTRLGGNCLTIVPPSVGTRASSPEFKRLPY